MEKDREFFGSRLGFVLAAAGNAVGLGNMWRFPYQTAEGGGAAFVLLYLLMTFVIGGRSWRRSSRSGAEVAFHRSVHSARSAAIAGFRWDGFSS